MAWTAGVQFVAGIDIFLNATMIRSALESVQLLIQWVSSSENEAAKF
jgi:hypothetical protein